MARPDQITGPSKEALERAAQTVAAGLNRLHPGYHFTVHHPGDPTPPGAITIPLSGPVDVEPVRRDR